MSRGNEDSDWIAPTGIRAYDSDATHTAIPAAAMSDPDLSLTAKGLYTLLLSYQGEPIDPFEDAIEKPAEIRTAIEELIALGYAIRVSR